MTWNRLWWLINCLDWLTDRPIDRPTTIRYANNETWDLLERICNKHLELLISCSSYTVSYKLPRFQHRFRNASSVRAAPNKRIASTMPNKHTHTSTMTTKKKERGLHEEVTHNNMSECVVIRQIESRIYCILFRKWHPQWTYLVVGFVLLHVTVSFTLHLRRSLYFALFSSWFARFYYYCFYHDDAKSGPD